MIKACLFDMDGTLINTEDLYTESMEDVLRLYNKGPFTWDVKIHLQGMPGPEAQQFMIDTYQIPVSKEEYVREVSNIQAGKWHRAEWLPDAKELLHSLKNQGVEIALGTSSNRENYLMKTAHLDFSIFGQHVVTGDDKRIPPGRGKPHPDIWYACLESINAERRELGKDEIKIEECLVFEDGLPGVRSGLKAGTQVIWIPHPDALSVLTEEQLALVDGQGERLAKLGDFDHEKYGLSSRVG